jgi:hypothetical protein
MQGRGNHQQEPQKIQAKEHTTMIKSQS